MSIWANFHFLRPYLLGLLLPAALFCWWCYRHRQVLGDWVKVADPDLLSWLTGHDQNVSRGISLWWLPLALLLTVVAVAGPSWQRVPQPGLSLDEGRVIVLDLSQSMLTQDLRPNRLAQAKFKLRDYFASQNEGQTGLVAFAGDAFVVTPLTSDTNTITNMLPALRPDIMPLQGSRIDRALEQAVELLQRSGYEQGDILLITDDVDRTADAAVEQSVDAGYRVSVLAVGTETGQPIPSARGYIQDQNGNIVIAKLPTAELTALAGRGKGVYLELTPELELTTRWQRSLLGDFSRNSESRVQQWRDEGPWLVLAILPLLLLGFRRGLVLALLLTLIPITPSHAGVWQDAWQTPDQQASKALRSGDPERAAGLAESPLLSGEASYRAGNYAAARDAFAQVDSAVGHYNRGNALAHLGELDEAIAAYEKTLEYDSLFTDAEANKALLEKLKQQQQEQNQESGENDESSEQSDQSQTEPNEGEPQQQEDQDSEQSEQSQQENQQMAEQEKQAEQEQLQANWSEEDQQAMEQWVQSIPDDPGGLLRQKFRRQYQRRERQDSETQAW